MGTQLDPTAIVGHKVVDAEGHKIGQAEQVYLDDTTGAPVWVTVKSGLFGTREHFAPLRGASIVEDDVCLACAKDQVDSAPDLDAGRHLSVEEEHSLRQHYGLGDGGTAPDQDFGRLSGGGMTGGTMASDGMIEAEGADDDRTDPGAMPPR